MYLDGIELAIDMLLGNDTTAVQASLATTLPLAGPFGRFAEFAGMEAVFNAIQQGNNT